MRKLACPRNASSTTGSVSAIPVRSLASVIGGRSLEMTSAQAPAPSAYARLGGVRSVSSAAEAKRAAQARIRPRGMTTSPVDASRDYARYRLRRNARGGLIVARRGRENGALALSADRLAVKDVEAAHDDDAGTDDQHGRRQVAPYQVAEADGPDHARIAEGRQDRRRHHLECLGPEDLAGTGDEADRGETDRTLPSEIDPTERQDHQAQGGRHQRLVGHQRCRT